MRSENERKECFLKYERGVSMFLCRNGVYISVGKVNISAVNSRIADKGGCR